MHEEQEIVTPNADDPMPAADEPKEGGEETVIEPTEPEDDEA